MVSSKGDPPFFFKGKSDSRCSIARPLYLGECSDSQYWKERPPDSMNLKYVLDSYVQQTDRWIEEGEGSEPAQVNFRDSNVPMIAELNAQMARVRASVKNFRSRAGDPRKESDSLLGDEGFDNDGGLVEAEIDPDP